MTQSAPDPQTGFRAVKAAILTRIRDGVWGPGTMLPTELEIADAFGVARGTANRALRELTDEGLLERRRKAGTFVRAAPVRSARLQIPLVRAEIEARGSTYRYALCQRGIGKPPRQVAERLGLADSDKTVHLQCLHLADGKPYQFEDRWISLAALPEAAAADFSQSGPNEWLVQTVPYSDVEMSFQAVSAQGAAARHLDLPEGSAILMAERMTWWQGMAITLVRLSFHQRHKVMTRY